MVHGPITSGKFWTRCSASLKHFAACFWPTLTHRSARRHHFLSFIPRTQYSARIQAPHSKQPLSSTPSLLDSAEKCTRLASIVSLKQNSICSSRSSSTVRDIITATAVPRPTCRPLLAAASTMMWCRQPDQCASILLDFQHETASLIVHAQHFA